MKKLLSIALLALSFSGNAQEVDAQSVINNNHILKTAYESTTLSLEEKIVVVNEQVSEGLISEQQAFQVISEILNQIKVEEHGEFTDEYDSEWATESNPFDYAMGVQMDTVVKYRTQITPYIMIGIGNVATNGAFANSAFGYLRSNSVEWGIAFRKPFSTTNNTWGVRYGLGFKYNGLATTQNQEFALAGTQTVTIPSDKELRKNYSYLRNTYINIPISLDFSTRTKTYNAANRRFTTKEGFNFGLGGYIGYNINSKQHIRYKNADGYKIYEQQKGDWNVNNLNYGLMAYAGTTTLKLVVKYDLNPLFKNNIIDQNYWSLGIQLGI